MLNAVLFIADPNMAALLRGMAGKSNEFSIEAIVELTTAGYGVARMLGTTRPDVMLLEMTEPARDLAQADAIHIQCPDIPLVALASRELQTLLVRNPNSNVTSIATWPFTVAELEQAISSAVHKLHGGIYEKVVAFLPGKAGSGASTVVLHIARLITQELKKKVLVVEGDLHSGLLSAILQVEPKYSIRDALANSAEAGSMTWQKYITQAGGVDFLLTKTAVKEPVPAWSHYLQLLRYANSKYDLVMVDLPEVVNSATAEVVRRARVTYVVSTPEFASLKLSQQRGQELAHWGVDATRVRALLNRGQRGDIGAKDAEKILQCPVEATFPNDYKAVRKAVNEGSSIDTRSELGAAYMAFSRTLMGLDGEEKKGSSWFRR